MFFSKILEEFWSAFLKDLQAQGSSLGLGGKTYQADL